MDIKQQLADAGVEIEHHFGGLVYAKVSHISAGCVLRQHAHARDHLSWLSAGTARLKVDGIETIESGPVMLLIPAYKEHEVTAVTDILWLCLWGTHATDPETADAEVITCIK